MQNKFIFIQPSGWCMPILKVLRICNVGLAKCYSSRDTSRKATKRFLSLHSRGDILPKNLQSVFYFRDLELEFRYSAVAPTFKLSRRGKKFQQEFILLNLQYIYIYI